jgi:hypothetical protein
MLASGLAGLLQELDSTRTPKPGCELIGLAHLRLGDRLLDDQAKRPGLDEVGGRVAERLVPAIEGMLDERHRT